MPHCKSLNDDLYLEGLKLLWNGRFNIDMCFCLGFLRTSCYNNTRASPGSDSLNVPKSAISWRYENHFKVIHF